jgi:hypothetical protein
LKMVGEGKDITNSEWVKFVDEWWNSENKIMNNEAEGITFYTDHHP